MRLGDRRNGRSEHQEPQERDPNAGGHLPPWSTLGLGPAPKSGFERAWEPTDEELAPTSDLPDRPPSRVGRSLKFIVPIVIGLILVGGAVASIRYDLIGGTTKTPTPTPSTVANVAATTTGTPKSAAAASPAPRTATPIPAPTSTTVPKRTPRAAPSATTTSTATATVTPRPNRSGSAVAQNKVLIAVGAREVAGLGGSAFAERLQEALAAEMPTRDVEVVGEDQIENAAIIISVDNPAPDFSAQVIANIPNVLVTSPRLPLSQISGEQAIELLNGSVTDWRDLGAGPTLKVDLLRLRGTSTVGADPVATYKTYAALVAGLAEHPGGVAIVPLDQVDYRVNVLAIDGIDPLRGQGAVLNYPLGERLYVGVRPELDELFQPPLSAALTKLGLPRAASPVASLGIAGDIDPAATSVPLSRLFDQVAPVLSSFDQTIANFAGVTTPDSATPVANASPVAISLPDLAPLKAAGIDAVSLANDQTFAEGDAAYLSLQTALDEASVASFGAGGNVSDARAPYRTEIDGVKVAVIGINGITANRDSALPGVSGNRDAASDDSAGTNPFVESRMRNDVELAAEVSDIVIVYLYGGVAGQASPPVWTISAAHEAIDAGADLVVVSHPGMPGAIETYKGQPILYSLGNLVSDQLGGVETRQGIVAEVTLRGDTIVGLRLHGVVTGDDGRPRPMTDLETATMLNRVWLLTDQLTESG